MDTLNYEVLAKSGYNGYILKNAPEKVLQFGEGNFLRAFAEVMFNTANAAGVTDLGVAIVTPTPRGSTARFRDQENIYTVLERGMENGSAVSRSWHHRRFALSK